MRDIDFKATTVNLLSATALELAQAYRARTLSPVEATRAILEAIPDFDSLNAFCHLNPELALNAARTSEQRYNEGAPLADVVIGYMDSMGYDLVANFTRTPVDGDYHFRKRVI